MNQRCILLRRHGNEKAVFCCPHGHEFVDYMLTAKQRRLDKKIGSKTNLDLLASWWKNGVYCECPKCEEDH